ncbi:hypothetical protein [Erysipelothrix anatis]|uniref:hypothetical protein n=1 Tax=Erysipelothrix anatis TaxID=2683713 RepID=UPI00135CC848|nr:hypothetical protein [Erysipelothrix anatis]
MVDKCIIHKRDRIFEKNRIGKFDVLPPFRKERKEMADYLNQKVVSIDDLIAEKEQVIRKYFGYTKSMVYEYVAGKK